MPFSTNDEIQKLNYQCIDMLQGNYNIAFVLENKQTGEKKVVKIPKDVSDPLSNSKRFVRLRKLNDPQSDIIFSQTEIKISAGNNNMNIYYLFPQIEEYNFYIEGENIELINKVNKISDRFKAVVTFLLSIEDFIKTTISFDPSEGNIHVFSNLDKEDEDKISNLLKLLINVQSDWKEIIKSIEAKDIHTILSIDSKTYQFLPNRNDNNLSLYTLDKETVDISIKDYVQCQNTIDKINSFNQDLQFFIEELHIVKENFDDFRNGVRLLTSCTYRFLWLNRELLNIKEIINILNDHNTHFLIWHELINLYKKNHRVVIDAMINNNFCYKYDSKNLQPQVQLLDTDYYSGYHSDTEESVDSHVMFNVAFEFFYSKNRQQHTEDSMKILKGLKNDLEYLKVCMEIILFSTCKDFQISYQDKEYAEKFFNGKFHLIKKAANNIDLKSIKLSRLMDNLSVCIEYIKKLFIYRYYYYNNKDKIGMVSHITILPQYLIMQVNSGLLYLDYFFNDNNSYDSSKEELFKDLSKKACLNFVYMLAICRQQNIAINMDYLKKLKALAQEEKNYLLLTENENILKYVDVAQEENKIFNDTQNLNMNNHNSSVFKL